MTRTTVLINKKRINALQELAKKIASNPIQAVLWEDCIMHDTPTESYPYELAMIGLGRGKELQREREVIEERIKINFEMNRDKL
jgi:hypothetical protein